MATGNHSLMTRNARVQRILSLEEDDLQALCESVDAAILDGGGFGWLQPQGRQVLERYFRGLLLVPERMLFAIRLDGVIVGGAQLIRAPRNNELQAMCVTLAHLFVAPYARKRGLGAALLQEVENAARNMGFRVLNADVLQTQTAAIALLTRPDSRYGADIRFTPVWGMSSYPGCSSPNVWIIPRLFCPPRPATNKKPATPHEHTQLLPSADSLPRH